MNLLKSLPAATAGTAFTPTLTVNIPAQPLAHGSQRRSLSWAKRICAVALMSLFFSLLASGKAAAISFTFEKIADIYTPVPGGTGTFAGSFNNPSLDNGNVAFLGLDFTNGSNGIYANIDGVLNVVADTYTSIPGGTGNFSGFSSSYSPSLDDGNVAFLGFGGINSAQRGIYTNIGGALNVVADLNTPIPGGTGNFLELGEALSLDNGNVAFVGIGGMNYEQRGIYTNIGGALNVVADENTPIPGGTGTFGHFDNISLNNGDVAFLGSSGDFKQSGIYTNIGGVLNVVADENTPIPDGTGTFGYFDDLSLDNGNVAFQGFSGVFDRNGAPTQAGIYTNVGGVLKFVAPLIGTTNGDTYAASPVGIGSFFPGIDAFGGPSLDDGNVAFSGLNFVDLNLGFGPSGIYTDIGGALLEVTPIGKLLDGTSVAGVFSGQDLNGSLSTTFGGKTFFSAYLGREGLSGDQIAFKAFFSDLSVGVYVATAVPEPSSMLGTLAISAFGAGWMLKRRQKKQQSASHAKPVE